MSIQRRRGQPAKIYRQRLEVDLRDDEQLVTAMDEEPYEVRAAFVPQRGSRAELAGQQEIVVYTMLVTSELQDVGLYSRVFWRDRYWDIIEPPQYHHGTRATRHWSFNIRERPT